MKKWKIIKLTTFQINLLIIHLRWLIEETDCGDKATLTRIYQKLLAEI